MFKWILLAICGGLLHAVWDQVNPYPKKDKPWTKWDEIFFILAMAFVLLSLLRYFEVI